MDFSKALHLLKGGLPVQRKGWNGENMHLQLQEPDKHSKMTLPYIFMYTAQGEVVPWVASQSDLLATDWRVVPY